MAQDYNEYLAINVLNEKQYVTYRLLSRALKVHSNLAKQMLYEFHRKQNAKKPGSVHATYLIAGTRQRRQRRPQQRDTAPVSQSNGDNDEDEDTVMQSSPPLLPSSSMARSEDDGAREDDGEEQEIGAVRSVVLVKEEQLAEAKESFESISSIHVYSLEPSTLNDLHVLTDCTRRVILAVAGEDVLQTGKQYGTIQNPNVKRRTRKTGPPPVMARDSVVDGKQDPTRAQTKSESKTASTAALPEPEVKSSAKPPAMKKQASDIFKSFAKSKTKPKQEDSQASEVSSTKPSQQEDEPMTGFSEDEEDGGMDDVVGEEAGQLPEGKSKKEREAELAAMMEQEDEPMEDADASAEEAQEPDDAIDKMESTKAEEEEPKESVTVENGRRRGKRRVMKKKTVKDEDGYLVTREEAAWESFSEDEPAAKKAKAGPVSSVNGGSKTAKKGGKAGQGNIMSFFAKK